MESVNLPTILTKVVAATEEGGRLLAGEFVRPSGPRGAGDYTEIGAEIEAMLRARLLDLLPARWLGEETSALAAPVSAWCWAVAPHNGTSAFLAGERGFAVSVALLHNGVPVLGVVHVPLSPDRGRDTIAWAEGMDHLLRNGRSVAGNLAHAKLAEGTIVFLGHTAAERPLANGTLVAPARFLALPSIAARLARVAAGEGVAAVSLDAPCSWDVAAGHALLKGAGGVLLDQSGREIVYSLDGGAVTLACFGGAPVAARELAARDWKEVRTAAAISRRTILGWPRIADDVGLDRAIGCLFGQVAGDDLGALVEFQSPRQIAATFPEGVRDLEDGGTWNTLAGQPTDDSELALDLARTLAVRTEWSSEAVAEAYGEWYASRPFDIGMTTRMALSAASRAETNKAAAAREAADRNSQANGALMRCASIGIWAPNPAAAAAAAREDALLSHPHPVCQHASAAFVAAISTAIGGGGRDDMLAAAKAVLEEAGEQSLLNVFVEACAGRGPEDFMSSQGWVLLAFRNAFRHLAVGTPLEEAIIETVHGGGDTDTNAAICGALLGAAEGRAAVPSRWALPILACRPFAAVGAKRPRPARYWPDDLPQLAEALLQRRREQLA